MENFCGILSNNESTKEKETAYWKNYLNYEQLEMLTDAWEDDLQKMQENFINQGRDVIEKDIQIENNVKRMLNMEEVIEAVNKKLCLASEDLDFLNEELSALDAYIYNIENLVEGIGTANIDGQRNTVYSPVIQLIMATEKFDAIMEEFEDERKKYMTEYRKQYPILNLLNKSFENLERIERYVRHVEDYHELNANDLKKFGLLS